jgi:hypothetical protein
MMLIQTSYQAIRDSIKPGDGFAMGAYDGFVSKFIKFWTRSELSHWATVLTLNEELIAKLIGEGLLSPPKIDKAPPRVVLVESTILSDKNGVQVNWASERTESYPGRVWWLPLSYKSRKGFNEKKFTEFMLSMIGRPYDKALIAHLLFDKLQLIPAREDWNETVCSELGAAGMKLGDLLPANLNSSEIVPQRMAEYRLWSENYYQLHGKAREIRKYNSRNPKDWHNG